MELLLLCWEFFKIGLFAIGGGMAAIPFLAQLAEKYPHWMSLEMLTDMIAVSESTPGPIGINMATYVGYTVAGIPGGILASLAVIFPSFVILSVVAGMLQRFRQNRLVDATFSGLRPAVTGLIAAAGFEVMKITMVRGGALQWLPLLLFVGMLVCTQTKTLGKLHPVLYIAIAAVLGILLKL